MKNKLINSFFYTILSSGIFFSFNFFIAKIIGANNYGQIVYYLSFINIIVIIVSFNYAALYMGNKITKDDKNTFSLFFTIETLLYLILLIPIYLVLSNFIQDIYTVYLVISIAYLVVILNSAGLEYNSNNDVVNSIKISALYPRILLVSFFTIMILIDYDKAIYYLISYLLANLIIYIYILIKFKPKFYFKKEILKRAWKFYLLGILGTTFTHIAQILQKEYGSYEQVATLAIVLLFFAGLSLISSVLIKFILPIMHEYYKHNQIEKIGEIYSNNTLLVTMLILPIVICLLFNIYDISYLLGSGYELLPIYFYILIVGYIFDLLTGITGNILRTTENEKFEIYNELSRFIFGLGFIYIFKDNTYGIAIAIALSMIIYNVLKFIEVYYLFKFVPIHKKQFLNIVILVSILSISLYFILMIDSIYLKYSLQLGIFSLVYIGIFQFIQSNKQLLQGYSR